MLRLREGDSCGQSELLFHRNGWESKQFCEQSRRCQLNGWEVLRDSLGSQFGSQLGSHLWSQRARHTDSSKIDHLKSK